MSSFGNPYGLFHAASMWPQNDPNRSGIPIPIPPPVPYATLISNKKKGRQKNKGGSNEMAEKDYSRQMTISISPGRLGLTLKIVEGGAKIMDIDPASMLRGQVNVGDLIVTVDRKKVSTMEDVTAGQERVRSMGVVKVAAAARRNKNKLRANEVDSVATERAATATVIHHATATGAANSEYYQMQLDLYNEKRFKKNETTVRVPNPNETTDSALTSSNGKGEKFPNLAKLGAVGDDPIAERKRQVLLAELLKYDRKCNKDTIAVSRGSRYQVICVPLKRNDCKSRSKQELDQEDLNNISFHIYQQQYHNVMDRFLNAWAEYCSGTNADAASMILFYLAKHYPQCYVKNIKNSDNNVAGMSTEKLNGPAAIHDPIELPFDFVSHDGTSDIKWNTRYSELFKYKEEFGDCKVFTKSDLGQWVMVMRDHKRKDAKVLTPRRIELLDNIGFLWSGLKEGHSHPNHRGDPRQNRATAAKIVYPQLTIRECLYLGGFEDEELDVIPNQKYSWRTSYVQLKDEIVSKVKKYDPAPPASRKKTTWVEIELLIRLLGEEDADCQQVFGECGGLLTQFLEAAEGRASQGIFEKPLRASTKRTNEELGTTSDDGGQQPAKKQAHLEVAENPLELAGLDSE